MQINHFESRRRIKKPKKLSDEIIRILARLEINWK